MKLLMVGLLVAGSHVQFGNLRWFQGDQLLSSTIRCHAQGRHGWACVSDDAATRGTVGSGNLGTVGITCQSRGGYRWTCWKAGR